MRNIVTGCAGFIGSHLVDYLLNKGEVVIGIDDLSTGSLRNIEQANQCKNFRFVESDCSNISVLDELISPMDRIYHLAATVGVIKVCEDSITTFNNNLKSTETILQIALKNKNRFFFASSSEVYGEGNGEGFNEDSPLVVRTDLGGRSAYVLSKLFGEHLCLNYYQQHDLPIVIGRFFNVIGPRQRAEFGMVLPQFIQQAQQNKPLTIYGEGKQTRSFCNVSDCVDAIYKVVNLEKCEGQIFNIGHTNAVQIIDLADYVIAETKSLSSVDYLDYPAQRKHGRDIFYRRANINKITSYTSWEPTIPWQKTVKELIAIS